MKHLYLFLILSLFFNPVFADYDNFKSTIDNIQKNLNLFSEKEYSNALRDYKLIPKSKTNPKNDKSLCRYFVIYADKSTYVGSIFFENKEQKLNDRKKRTEFNKLKNEALAICNQLDKSN